MSSTTVSFSTPTSSPSSVIPFVAASSPASSSISISISTSTSGSVPSSSASGSSVPSSGGGNGIAYGPLSSDGFTCKSDSEILSDLQKLEGYSTIRIYDTVCLDGVLAGVKATGLKVFAGICNLIDAGDGARKIAAVFGGNWDVIDTVAVGNEVVATGANTPSDVAAAITTTRDTLRGLGYQGPVVSVDILWTVIANPELCEYSDYVAVNAHAFFDQSASAETAGTFIKTNYQNLQYACPGKQVVVTESGWPSAGDSHGNAVPSKENQGIAVSGLKSAFSDNPSTLFLFSTLDELWKIDNAGTYGAEKHWGIYP
jgi:exo-beta-1,3-glucanase (GH17 family)